ncbi:CRE-SRG-30 protein [Caenorhabditis remanei]|uniref:Serpentine receptor class gamma n=1 Tax=Caenorhabditis remanei TaxID=31234 RepID=E3LTG7_CAERE|nr:CRE-SRG-30 protein [Caenorhabditis remanei]
MWWFRQQIPSNEKRIQICFSPLCMCFSIDFSVFSDVIMLRCHPGFYTNLEILKYGIQVVYFLLGLFFHVSVLKILHRKWNVYSKFPFLQLYYVDSILSIFIILMNVGLIRIFNYIPPLCPWALKQYPEPTQFISLLFIEQYFKFVKCLIFCFMIVNRANCVICPMSVGTIQKCVIPHVIMFSFLSPFIGVWTAFLSESQFIPFQGGFIHESKMTFHWITVPNFSVIISFITIVTVCICSLICMICVSRTRSENRHTEQSLTASAICMSIFYVFALSMEIYFHQSHASSLEMFEFWRALSAFSFDILVVCPPVIMLCLNVRLRVDAFPQNNTIENTLSSPK